MAIFFIFVGVPVTITFLASESLFFAYADAASSSEFIFSASSCSSSGVKSGTLPISLR